MLSAMRLVFAASRVFIISYTCPPISLSSGRIHTNAGPRRATTEPTNQISQTRCAGTASLPYTAYSGTARMGGCVCVMERDDGWTRMFCPLLSLSLCVCVFDNGVWLLCASL